MYVVVVCTDVSGKEPHRQVFVKRVMISGSQGSVIVGTQARNERGVCSSPALGEMFTIYVTLMTYVTLIPPLLELNIKTLQYAHKHTTQDLLENYLNLVEGAATWRMGLHRDPYSDLYSLPCTRAVRAQ